MVEKYVNGLSKTCWNVEQNFGGLGEFKKTNEQSNCVCVSVFKVI